MRLTLTQQVIMAEIRKSGSITARRVMEITGCVYRDSMDYVYQTLGRMVKAGLIKRTGIGVFVVADNGLAAGHVVHYLVHIGRAAHLQPKLGSLPGLVHLPRGMNKRLAGYATVVEAVAAHILSGFINQQHPHIGLGHKQRQPQPGRTGSE